METMNGERVSFLSGRKKRPFRDRLGNQVLRRSQASLLIDHRCMIWADLPMLRNIKEKNVK